MRIRHVIPLILIGATALASCSGSGSVPADPANQPGSLPRQAAVSSPSSPQIPACRIQTLIGTVSERTVAARRAPDPSAREVASLAMTNAQGAGQVFDLLDRVQGSDSSVWYRALLPVRPNGTTGFIPARSLRLSQTPYRLQVDRSRLELTLWKGCEVVARYPTGLGTKGTPTPVGTFYLVSLVKPPTAGSIYGAYAYGLSAYSDALTNWAGGGIIGLHGTNDPSSIGRRESHGCIRMLNRDIEHLTKILPLGTPIEID